MALYGCASIGAWVYRCIHIQRCGSVGVPRELQGSCSPAAAGRCNAVPALTPRSGEHRGPCRDAGAFAARRSRCCRRSGAAGRRRVPSRGCASPSPAHVLPWAVAVCGDFCIWGTAFRNAAGGGGGGVPPHHHFSPRLTVRRTEPGSEQACSPKKSPGAASDTRETGDGPGRAR